VAHKELTIWTNLMIAPTGLAAVPFNVAAFSDMPIFMQGAKVL